ncbi:MAG: hypothetical protein HY889_06790 [Deltaproteobacteria bacterium]|nr:hypothetical protein [Deltaproteobacteria bacterium]
MKTPPRVVIGHRVAGVEEYGGVNGPKLLEPAAEKLHPHPLFREGGKVV